MNEEKPSKLRLLRKILMITLAWITLPVLGVLLLIITSGASVDSHGISSGLEADPVIWSLNGLLGVILVLILLILTYRFRKTNYFRHLRIGLYIGLGIYFLIMAGSIITNTVIASNPNMQDTCTSRLGQFRSHADAIVPIATDLGSGTGFAVKSGDLVLTAYHVVDGASEVYANFSSGRVDMEILETAPQYDLALLRLSKPATGFFNLSETYSTADEIYAYGYPGNSLSGGPASLSAGIISRVIDIASLRMNSTDMPDGLEIIQTDSAINPGNSGGPLIGACGVIGIVSFISDTSQLHEYTGTVSEQNIGFAISAKTAIRAFGSYF